MSDSVSMVYDDYLIVPSKTALPLRCVRTNEEVSAEEYRTWDLPVISQDLMILMLLVPAALLFAPLCIKRRCKLRAGLSREIYRRYQLRKVFGIGLIFAAVLLPVLALFLQNELFVTLALAGFVPSLWGGFAILMLFSRPLRNVKLQEDRYWIAGCSSLFLAGLTASDD